MDAMQPIRAPAEEPLPQLVAELAATCAARPEGGAVYLFESTFGEEGDAVVTVGLVHEDASDPDLFVPIKEAIRLQRYGGHPERDSAQPSHSRTARHSLNPFRRISCSG
jgi:hypothetical protein